MAYLPGKTIAKVATPIGIVLILSNVLQYVAALVGPEISDEHSYITITVIYGVFRGVFNWTKNRKKSGY